MQERVALYGSFLQPHPLLEPLMTVGEVNDAVMQARLVLGLPTPLPRINTKKSVSKRGKGGKNKRR
jgi:hypothetical protein